MDRLKRKYLLLEDGSPDELYHSIDCLEKIFYHALCDFEHVDKKYAFCDDINIRTHRSESGFGVDLNKLRLNDSLFIKTEFKPSPQDAFDIIEEFIDKGHIVAICTMFDRLKPYSWYQHPDKIDVSNTHFCLIVGYDEHNVYFVDDPSMLVQERLIKHQSNPTIGVIDKKSLIEAFSEYCMILTVQINQPELSHIDKFDAVLNSIKENYRNCSVKNKNGTHTITGRNALMAISMFARNPASFEFAAKNFFPVYLFARKREIFKLCLLDKINDYSYAEDTISILEENIAAWKGLHLLFCKHDVSAYDNIRMRAKQQFECIIDSEDALMDSIAQMERI